MALGTVRPSSTQHSRTARQAAASSLRKRQARSERNFLRKFLFLLSRVANSAFWGTIEAQCASPSRHYFALPGMSSGVPWIFVVVNAAGRLASQSANGGVLYTRLSMPASSNHPLALTRGTCSTIARLLRALMQLHTLVRTYMNHEQPREHDLGITYGLRRRSAR